jgi:hypothetical protein
MDRWTCGSRSNPGGSGGSEFGRKQITGSWVTPLRFDTFLLAGGARGGIPRAGKNTTGDAANTARGSTGSCFCGVGDASCFLFFGSIALSWISMTSGTFSGVLSIGVGMAAFSASISDPHVIFSTLAPRYHTEIVLSSPRATIMATSPLLWTIRIDSIFTLWTVR